MPQKGPKVGYVEREPAVILQTARPHIEGEAMELIGKPPTRKLTGHGAVLWNHYLPYLTKEYGKVDLFMLEDYCYKCHELRDKEEELEAEGAYVVTKEGLKPHPLVSVTNKWGADKKRLESELGIGAYTKKKMKKLDKTTGDSGGDNPITDEYDK